MTEPKIALQNDWAKLEEAVHSLQEEIRGHLSCFPDECSLSASELDDDVRTIAELVPKLLESYGRLWELSMNLAEAWE